MAEVEPLNPDGAWAKFAGSDAIKRLQPLRPVHLDPHTHGLILEQWRTKPVENRVEVHIFETLEAFSNSSDRPEAGTAAH